MNKTELWAEVQKALSAHKADEKLINELAKLLAPKVGHRDESFPPKTNKKGEIIEVYCIWHQKYEPVEEFNKSTKTKHGYSKECKQGLKEWYAYDKEIKPLEARIVNLVDSILDGIISTEEGKETKKLYETEINALKAARSNKLTLEEYKASL